MQWCTCSRHCGTSRKVAVSIPNGVIGIFHLHYSSVRTMSLRSNQPLTEIVATNIWCGGGDKGDRCVGLTPYHLHMPNVLKSGTSNSWNFQGLSRPVQGLFYLCKRKATFQKYNFNLGSI